MTTVITTKYQIHCDRCDTVLNANNELQAQHAKTVHDEAHHEADTADHINNMPTHGEIRREITKSLFEDPKYARMTLEAIQYYWNNQRGGGPDGIEPLYPEGLIGPGKETIKEMVENSLSGPREEKV